MSYLLLLLMLAGILAVVGVLVLLDQVRQRNLHRWLPSYFRDRKRRSDPQPGQAVHLLLCLADHFEPIGSSRSSTEAWEMLQRWLRDYPRLFAGVRDSDGRPPRHTFFYPLDEYESAYLDGLAKLCQAGFGEVEVHLHHEGDVAEELRGVLLTYKQLLHQRHGLLPVHRQTGEVKYGFIHGNWALDNSLPGGHHCGVDEELEVLRQTGCYADFTLPSAPSAAQTQTINRLYYAVEDGKPKSHERGVAVSEGPIPEKGLLMIQGPLLLDWQRARWGVLPRIENACLQGSQPPTLERLRLWLRARVQVPTRPDWYVVKLHCHGARGESADVLLGDAMVKFHQELAQLARENSHFHFHYLSAREVYNLIKAAESGYSGKVADALDFELLAPPGLRNPSEFKSVPGVVPES